MADAQAALKAQLKQLIAQRDLIEQEIAERTARLNAPGQPGLNGSLLDAAGFPRADIDLPAVRADRSRVICLTNDHKALSRKLEQLMHELHSIARNDATAAHEAKKAKTEPNGSSAATHTEPPASQAAGAAAAAGTGGPDAGPAAAAAAQPMEVDAAAGSGSLPDQQHCRPFALVDEVSDASPASAAGIAVGDQMCKFGEVTWPGSGPAAAVLPQVAAALQANKGRQVEAVVLRQGRVVQLQLVPREWPGRGLLGCHLRPL